MYRWNLFWNDIDIHDGNKDNAWRAIEARWGPYTLLHHTVDGVINWAVIFSKKPPGTQAVITDNGGIVCLD